MCELSQYTLCGWSYIPWTRISKASVPRIIDRVWSICFSAIWQINQTKPKIYQKCLKLQITKHGSAWIVTVTDVFLPTLKEVRLSLSVCYVVCLSVNKITQKLLIKSMKFHGTGGHNGWTINLISSTLSSHKTALACTLRGSAVTQLSKMTDFIPYKCADQFWPYGENWLKLVYRNQWCCKNKWQFFFLGGRETSVHTSETSEYSFSWWAVKRRIKLDTTGVMSLWSCFAWWTRPLLVFIGQMIK